MPERFAGRRSDAVKIRVQTLFSFHSQPKVDVEPTPTVSSLVSGLVGDLLLSMRLFHWWGYPL